MAYVGQVYFTGALYRFWISRLRMTWVLCRALLQARCKPSSGCKDYSDVQHRSMHCGLMGPEAWEPNIEVYYIRRKGINRTRCRMVTKYDQIIPNRIKHENTEVYGVLLTCNGSVLLDSPRLFGRDRSCYVRIYREFTRRPRTTA